MINDLILNGKTYYGVDKVLIPNTEGTMSVYYSENSEDGKLYTISVNGSNYVLSNGVKQVRRNDEYRCEIYPKNGYIISGISITVGGISALGYVVNRLKDATIAIGRVTGDVVVTITTINANNLYELHTPFYGNGVDKYIDTGSDTPPRYQGTYSESHSRKPADHQNQ